jgi:hypothetical protein
MIDWKKLFGLLFLILFGAFIFDKYDDRKLLRGFYADAADQLKPLLGLMTRQEVAAEHHRLKDLTAAREEAELRLADKLEQERLAQERQLEQERMAEEEQERVAKERELEQELMAQKEQERAAKYAAALDRAYALGRGELSQRAIQPSSAGDEQADELDDSLMSSFRYAGVYLTDARVTDLTARGVKVEGANGSGGSSVIVVPLEEAARRVDLKLKVGKQIADAIANPSKWKKAWKFPHHAVTAQPSSSDERYRIKAHALEQAQARARAEREEKAENDGKPVYPNSPRWFDHRPVGIVEDNLVYRVSPNNPYAKDVFNPRPIGIVEDNRVYRVLPNNPYAKDVFNPREVGILDKR